MRHVHRRIVAERAIRYLAAQHPDKRRGRYENLVLWIQRLNLPAEKKVIRAIQKAKSIGNSTVHEAEDIRIVDSLRALPRNEQDEIDVIFKMVFQGVSLKTWTPPN